MLGNVCAQPRSVMPNKMYRGVLFVERPDLYSFEWSASLCAIVFTFSSPSSTASLGAWIVQILQRLALLTVPVGRNTAVKMLEAWIAVGLVVGIQNARSTLCNLLDST